MNSVSGPNAAKGPNGLMIVSSVLMVLGSLITGYILISEFLFITENPRYESSPDIVAALIVIILLVMEICYALFVLRARLGDNPFEPQKMKVLATRMLVLNCILFVWCYISMRVLEGWTSEGYFTLADVLAFSSIPGIFVKILAQEGASRSAAS